YDSSFFPAIQRHHISALSGPSSANPAELGFSELNVAVEHHLHCRASRQHHFRTARTHHSNEPAQCPRRRTDSRTRADVPGCRTNHRADARSCSRRASHRAGIAASVAFALDAAFVTVHTAPRVHTPG